MEELSKTSTRHKFSKKNKILRVVWSITYIFLFRPFTLRIFKKWRVLVLKCFGADISWTAMINSSTKIWAPWNLKMHDYACLGPKVDCYNQGKITIGKNATISQKSYLCASSHDYTSKKHELYLAPIYIEENSWVAAESFIGPGVTIGQGSVVGARAAVFKNVEAWTIVGGNPAKFIKKREILN
ncbi:putative colanic acid biosynthesis acetyltransferase [Cellulophaga baltica]|uniref:putative colanic acid biosynthesis acetyltransferase n=1 Tax=Cellulophaga TaxID=104264 RepID=UPI001C07C15A|nr:MULTISPECIES: putative colanic acid biosynthesis acetyltransferase [Cellulophaga]MBU2995650.1 putative colanic acid biosynthesis acetyltransferase [Cellulophaga baltica]MDO6767044.1 putative colanic acid biosynthesis acetyltransferase [Cellulophaga sp. 1_MG-2023]